MKKFFVLILVAIALFVFSGCNTQNNSNQILGDSWITDGGWNEAETWDNLSNDFEDDTDRNDTIISTQLLQEQLKDAQRRCDFLEIERLINAIIDAQNQNGYQYEIIHFGSISNCTTTYDVNDTHMSKEEIDANAFGKDFEYRNISVGNVTYAIQKSTDYSAEELYQLNPLVTICGNSNNGYDFYLKV